MSAIMGHYPIQLHISTPNTLHRDWPLAKDFIQSAIDESIGEMQIDDVLARVLHDRMMLVLLRREHSVVGAATLEFQQHARRLIAVIVHLGARRIEDFFPLLPEVKLWAKLQGAESLMLYGRKGWERKLKAVGGKLRYVCMEV